ncbi:MAG: hypothetical protein F6K31_07645 [Symploca sp. SIO2G7]|nr:hypothetical protein [Symploca sp. SIO2G7]
MGIGNWELGIGNWGLGIGDWELVRRFSYIFSFISPSSLSLHLSITASPRHRVTASPYLRVTASPYFT